ncbi:uncharacterized protein LOC114473529 [Gouania willdenowi]|uniref:uncharacterized protein LOC114473529 n=1 Tax=Gouania willdenowi TaxID=441366 RepID=UPI00105536F8|nr:uncharacterized protein LOC114473529 [Gouania willdenowi]
MTEKGRRAFTDAETLALIKARVKLNTLFGRKRNSAKLGWEQVVKEMGLEGQVTAMQASKKWDNLKTKYKELRNPLSRSYTDNVEATAANWPWFDVMHEVLGDGPIIQLPTLVSSCPMPKVEQIEPSSSSLQPATDDEESQPPTKRKRVGPLLTFLREQAKKDDAFNAALLEQNERFLSLLGPSKMTSQRKKDGNQQLQSRKRS